MKYTLHQIQAIIGGKILGDEEPLSPVLPALKMRVKGIFLLLKMIRSSGRLFLLRLLHL
ncbi:hypothetical protein [Candidatus Kuenenia stuttgartiensis]|uniref:hypothetical protein n=1 Tax=Kuenenia stuttgartiensis TaxID=174633 RepID=UPI001E59E109|nr:hypothetical protein [Candidatus Kuenenia stuttgartiensis]